MRTDRGVRSRPSEWGLAGEREGVVGDSAASSGETGAKLSARDLKSSPATGDPAPVVVYDAGAGGCGLLGSQDGYSSEARCSFSIAATLAGYKFVEPRRGLSSLDMRSLFVKQKARSSVRVRDQCVREEYGAMGFFSELDDMGG